MGIKYLENEQQFYLKYFLNWIFVHMLELIVKIQLVQDGSEMLTPLLNCTAAISKLSAQNKPTFSAL